MGIISWKNYYKYFSYFIDIDIQRKNVLYENIVSGILVISHFPWLGTVFSLYSYPQSSASELCFLTAQLASTYFETLTSWVLYVKILKAK